VIHVCGESELGRRLRYIYYVVGSHGYILFSRLHVLLGNLMIEGVAPSSIGREVLVRWNQGCYREMLRCHMLPHLLLVGALNSSDQDPAGSCRRLSEERGGGGGPISREIRPPLPPHVSFTPPDLTGSDSDRLKDVEEEDCCPIGSRDALSYGRQIVVYNMRRCTTSYE